MAQSIAGVAQTREVDDIIWDTLQKLEDSKRPKIELKPDKKFACIDSIIDKFNFLIKELFGTKRPGISDEMDADDFPQSERCESRCEILFSLLTTYVGRKQRTLKPIWLKRQSPPFLIANESLSRVEGKTFRL